MDTSQTGHFILELMQSLGAKIGEDVHIDELVNRAIEGGASLDQIEDSMVHASANGWIMIVGEAVQLTVAGGRLLSPANDN